MSQAHVPVLANEVLEYLDVTPSRNYVDATVNGGGHARAILEASGPEGKVLGIDWDIEIISKILSRAESRDKNQISKSTNRLILEQGNFADLESIVRKHNFGPVHGILFDLGLSSWHLEQSGRGFSFQEDEPLDMRYWPDGHLTAAEIVNQWPEREIERMLREYGEEKFSRQIAREIIKETQKKNPIATTLDLARIIKQATPQWYHRKSINPATKTFQALRIAVNHELESIERALPQAIRVLARGGRLAVITFHSLEDRIVKNFFRDQARQKCGSVLTKKVIRPGREEINQNPRARSAKLRAFEKK